MTRLPRNTDEWNAERDRLVGHIRALLLEPNSPQVRRKALDHMIEVFEDQGLEEVTP